ncbi:MAG: hypothetical protein K2P49_08580, partial [Oscillospiraceae bacterium]|nr:hypothetical protein [Oscillospiraceae bacterium]
CYPPPAEKLQNFFGVFLQFQIGVDTSIAERHRQSYHQYQQGMTDKPSMTTNVNSRGNKKSRPPSLPMFGWTVGGLLRFLNA